MFFSLAAQETYVAETNFAARKQETFLPEVKNIFAPWTQILCPKHMFPMKTMLTSFQFCWSKRTTIAGGKVKTEETQAGYKKEKGKKRNWRGEEIVTHYVV